MGEIGVRTLIPIGIILLSFVWMVYHLATNNYFSQPDKRIEWFRIDKDEYSLKFKHYDGVIFKVTIVLNCSPSDGIRTYKSNPKNITIRIPAGTTNKQLKKYIDYMDFKSKPLEYLLKGIYDNTFLNCLKLSDKEKSTHKEMRDMLKKFISD